MEKRDEEKRHEEKSREEKKNEVGKRQNKSGGEKKRGGFVV